jgi:hypothetical protein
LGGPILKSPGSSLGIRSMLVIIPAKLFLKL